MAETFETPNSLESEKDLTGQQRMVGNIIASWAGHFVFIVAGFVMPRLVNDMLGRELLGVWDFAWSLVAYFSLVEAGVASSVNRYVARYRVEDDSDSINRTVSSALFIVGLAGLLVILLSVGVSLLTSVFFADKLKENIDAAQWGNILFRHRYRFRYNVWPIQQCSERLSSLEAT